jgi:hypothetical protein
MLGALAPPAPGQKTAPTELTASGTDFATTTRAKLTTASVDPGPNTFTLRITDYDSGDPIRRALVRLRFVSLDDPAAAPTSLALHATRSGDYTGAGANLSTYGRWRVTALVQRGADATTIPLDVNVTEPKQFVSVLAVPGRAPQYTMPIEDVGALRIAPHPLRAGPSSVTIQIFDLFGGMVAVTPPVVTATPNGDPTRVPPVRRLGVGHYAAVINLKAGPFAIGVTTHAANGSRIHGVFELKVPGD